jgi:hypothetical protein
MRSASVYPPSVPPFSFTETAMHEATDDLEMKTRRAASERRQGDVIASAHHDKAFESRLVVSCDLEGGRFSAGVEDAPPCAPTLIVIGACPSAQACDSGATSPSLAAPVLVCRTGTTNAEGRMRADFAFAAPFPSGIRPVVQAVTLVAGDGAPDGVVVSNPVAISP